LTNEGYGIKIAEPEKALLDFLYFHPKLVDEADFETYRFNLAQMREDINAEQLTDYGSLFASPALERRLSIIQKMIYHA
jgi:hypothetical protein